VRIDAAVDDGEGDVVGPGEEIPRLDRVDVGIGRADLPPNRLARVVQAVLDIELRIVGNRRDPADRRDLRDLHDILEEGERRDHEHHVRAARNIDDMPAVEPDRGRGLRGAEGGRTGGTDRRRTPDAQERVELDRDPRPAVRPGRHLDAGTELHEHVIRGEPAEGIGLEAEHARGVGTAGGDGRERDDRRDQDERADDEQAEARMAKQHGGSLTHEQQRARQDCPAPWDR